MTPNNAILITGCSSGIGRCLAVGLKARGYRVFASVRQKKDLAGLAALGLETLMLDLASSASIQRAVDDVLARTGGQLFALVNNGAYGQPGAVEDLSRALLREQFETNLFGTHELTCRLLPVFRAQGGGRIIQISSVLGLVSLAYRGAYNASKFALEGLSDTLRLELAGSGIHVVLIEPGPIVSRFRQNAYAAFKANIDREHSAYRDYYIKVERRLAGSKNQPFTLPPEAVLKKVVRVLEARRPKPRYFVTFPTVLFAVLRRLLPARWLDRVLWAVTGRGR
ncbi:MAG: short-chain dehydrogenase [Candidatus Muproteobacteria bacterium RBG_16_64_11]|uniref:Short-chain dehydrogenase n=1 Tax=Candidatus Muproteobacteria bacterium RBG_16_64_11 TaxID=1817758 RepID=A0A1F6TDT8_9PROT|nr:MAG: short-chain dehydrogenase [Candidatus Muproteobacteria bacterium RBG_16_64_11]